MRGKCHTLRIEERLDRLICALFAFGATVLAGILVNLWDACARCACSGLVDSRQAGREQFCKSPPDWPKPLTLAAGVWYYICRPG